MALPNWMPNISQCKCVLVYTDLRHMKSPASLAHGKPEQQYDPHGHYACSGCHKDYKFDGPYYHPRLMLDTIMEQHGFVFHCDHGVDVCIRCAGQASVGHVPGQASVGLPPTRHRTVFRGHTIAGVTPGSKIIDRISAAKRKRSAKSR